MIITSYHPFQREVLESNSDVMLAEMEENEDNDRKITPQTNTWKLRETPLLRNNLESYFYLSERPKSPQEEDEDKKAVGMTLKTMARKKNPYISCFTQWWQLPINPLIIFQRKEKRTHLILDDARAIYFFI